MALPGYFHTAERIIRQALLDAGRLQLGSEPSPDAHHDARDRLADIIHTAQVDGLKLWLNNLRTITMVAGQAAYDFDDPRELRPLNCWYVLSTGNRRPLNLHAWESFYTLGDLTQEGLPTDFFSNKRQSKLTVQFWPVPNAQAVAEATLELLCQTQPTAPVELTDELGFPVEWYMYLRWALADELATGQPEAIVARCAAKAGYYKEKLEAWDVEDGPSRFQPDLAHAARSRFAR
jgi:hypothetical protein